MTDAGFHDLWDVHGAAFRDLGISEETVARLGSYLRILTRRNQDLNLVSRKLSPEALVTDHLLDSLIALPHFPHVARVADLGTGGGFPAVPLALCRPETEFLLFEKSPLKCAFLTELQTLCPNLRVMGPLDPARPFPTVDVVTARGFKALREILTLTAAHRKRGGAYVLYKARRARIDEEVAAVKGLKVRVVALRPYGDAAERHLVCMP